MATIVQPSAPPMPPQGRVPYRWTVEKYEEMVASGLFTKRDRLELIEGHLVEKMTQNSPHSVTVGLCDDVIRAVLPAGWHTRQEKPVRIPERNSMPEPDVAVVRGKRVDWLDRHPGTADLALVVEVSETTVLADRAMALTYGGGSIPAYWIVNLVDRRLEAYASPIDGAYPAPAILGESDAVDLIIDGRVVGRIAVADLLPGPPRR